MDVFSKLKSRLDQLALTPRKASAGNLLHKFQICWDAVQYELTAEAEENLTRTVDETDIPSSLQQMLDILLKEQRSLETGLISANSCAEMFLNTDLLGQLVALSATDTPLGFRREVISMLSALISLLEGQSLFHKSVNGAIRVLIAEALADRSFKYETEMLELESNIATKIKELPALLNLFFIHNTMRPKNVPTQEEEQEESRSDSPSPPVTQSVAGGMVGAITVAPSVSSAYQFPLFDHLMRYLNTEGRHGDVARTSCSLLLDVGTPDMQKYLAESDFVIVVTAGLGGLFSQLPAQLPADAAIEGRRRHGGRQGYASVTFARDVESLQGLVAFAQSVVARWPDDHALAGGILRGFRRVFLDHAVKPQLMTASDFDGTTVAVLFYVRKMLAAVAPRSEIAEVIIRFLLDGEEGGDEAAPLSRGTREGLASTNADQADRSDHDVELQVRDVLISKLNSLSEPVVTDTLRLFHLLLLNDPSLALPLLVDAIAIPAQHAATDGASALSAPPPPVVRALDPEQQSTVVREWFALIDRAGGGNAAAAINRFETSLDAYLHDAEQAVAAYNNDDNDNHRQQQFTPTSPIRLDRDPTLHKLLDKTATFFSQTPGINLALTGVLAHLAASVQLAPYLFAADHIFPLAGDGNGNGADVDEVDEDGIATQPPRRTSLHTTIAGLNAEVDARRAAMGEEAFEARMALAVADDADEEEERARARIGATGSGGSSDPWRGTDYGGGETRDDFVERQWWKNVLVLNEFAKEMVALLIVSDGIGQQHIEFV
ncbi:hypothetical protein HDU87_007346 [Geranomyces variabilis]|uniref:FHF complex subunit HOOK-interacting protein C-terminal domain-containing protein n=1 Tax=Geranomyces variabilis TaxID=109894 RepID=A0AAD5TEQ7_9FUNG|nr:hypothetical protein HDU87_007346 [Geranomyces variabilis]